MNTRPVIQSIIFVLIGILTTVILVGAKIVFDQTDPGRRFESYSYETLQSSLPYSTHRDNMPVIVVDISKLEGDKDDKPTPRDKLTELIDAIAKENSRAIAIDIDFSLREDNNWQDYNDPDFFDHCLKLKEAGLPVFLGVERGAESEPKAWLGIEKYKSLAASMRFDSPDANRVQLWLKPEGTTEIIPSISLALANTYEKGIPQPPQLFAPMLVKIEDYEQRVDQANASRFTYATTLVNYSMLDAIESQSLAATSHYTIDDNDWRFQDKLVLIGRLNWTNKLIRVIGRSSDAPGVLLDAAATYSLIKSPLFEFTTKARVLIDIVLSLLVLSLVTLARFRNRKNALYDWRGTQWLLVLAMVTVVFVGGIILVRSTGIIWFDFLAVIIVLLFHPVVEKKLGARINQLTKRN